MEFKSGGDCWEIASNSNCDLESQLGFLVKIGKINLGFLILEGKTITCWVTRMSEVSY